MDFEKATLKKTAVSTLPPWVEQDQDNHHSSSPSSSSRFEPPTKSPPSSSSDNTQSTATPPASSTSISGTQLLTDNSNNNNGTGISGKSSPSQFATRPNSSSTINPAQKSHGRNHGPSQSQQDWSIFATMSNVSTISGISHKYNGSHSQGSSLFATSNSILPSSSLGRGSNTVSNLRTLPQKLDGIFNSKSAGHFPIDMSDGSGTADNFCTCTCTQHRRGGSEGRLSSTPSKRRNQKESKEASRGYPTGQSVSTVPPDTTTWDEKDAEIPLTQQRSTAKNTAFNLEAMKAFLNSPLFSNFLKFLTIIASLSLFAIALNGLILVKDANDNQTQLSNANADLIVTITLSIMTIAYSCFTIFLESRRPPEGLDSSKSKPLFVIFSEIIASIVWSQVLSVTIYIYIWTYGCTADGERQIDMIWTLDVAEQKLTERLCRRQGAMVGLELLLVVLLIFNFYTHLAQNFKFIRAVS